MKTLGQMRIVRPISGGSDAEMTPAETKDVKEQKDALDAFLDEVDAIPEVPGDVVIEEEPGKTTPPPQTEEVVVVDEQPPAETVTVPPADSRAGLPENVRQALSRLDDYERREREDTERRRTTESSDGTRETEKRTEQVEMVEILPGSGFRLPKDETQWPIQVAEQTLLQLGWNENPARAIAILGNMFYDTIIRRIPPMTAEIMEAGRREVEAQNSRQNSFWDKFSDLKEHSDFVQFTEQRLRQNEEFYTKNRGEDYLNALGRAVRTDLAKMRGLTLEQYEAEVTSTQSSGNGRTTVTHRPAPVSRATTTSTGSRSGAGGRPPAFESELRDME